MTAARQVPDPDTLPRTAPGILARHDGPVDVPIPPDLLAAAELYERALADDDLAVLDAMFAPGPATLRGDAAGLLVGHEAISAFRGARGGVPPRTITRIEHRPCGEGFALLVSVSRYADGGSGLQTQLWQRLDGHWRIAAAHVAPRPQALDTSVWRVLGDPLVPAVQDGPLTGLSVAVKDLFAVAGQRIGAGNPAFLAESRPQGTDADAVADLRDGGATVRGIARTDEFAYSIAGRNAHHGTPPNAAVPGTLPGGSSSGPASAVGLGQAAVGLATDTAGSVRVPASYQGLWGLRTTHGRISRAGLLPLAPSFDTVGWLTRDGSTLERVVAHCLPNAAGASAPLPWHLSVPTDLLAAVEPATAAAFEALLATLARDPAGPELAHGELGDLDRIQDVFRTVQGAEAWATHGTWVREHPGQLGADVAERFGIAARIGPAEEAAARTDLTALRARLTDRVRDTVLILPTVPGAAPPLDIAGDALDAVRAATLRLTTPAAVGGLPSISLPLLTVPGPRGPAPLGIALIARAGSDLALVRLARRLASLVGTARGQEPA